MFSPKRDDTVISLQQKERERERERAGPFFLRLKLILLDVRTPLNLEIPGASLQCTGAQVPGDLKQKKKQTDEQSITVYQMM